MAISSSGYDGTVNEAQWSSLLRYAGGAEYGVVGGGWAATKGPGTRQVTIGTGTGFGKGIIDTSDAPEVLTHASVPSGQRWDLIVARRDRSTNETTFAIVTGGSTKAIPSRAQFGSIDEQPLWLVRVVAGQSAVADMVDLRVWQGDGGAYAEDDLVRAYLTRTGTRLRIGGVRWARELNSTGSALWVREDVIKQVVTAAGKTTGEITAKNQRDELLTLKVPGAIPVGARLDIDASAMVWVPPGGNCAGTLAIYRGATMLRSRRWHSHNHPGTWLTVALSMKDIVTSAVDAGGVYRLLLSNDETSAGGVEVWDAHATLSVS